MPGFDDELAPKAVRSTLNGQAWRVSLPDLPEYLSADDLSGIRESAIQTQRVDLQASAMLRGHVTGDVADYCRALAVSCAAGAYSRRLSAMVIDRLGAGPSQLPLAACFAAEYLDNGNVARLHFRAPVQPDPIALELCLLFLAERDNKARNAVTWPPHPAPGGAVALTGVPQLSAVVDEFGDYPSLEVVIAEIDAFAWTGRQLGLIADHCDRISAAGAALCEFDAVATVLRSAADG